MDLEPGDTIVAGVHFRSGHLWWLLSAAQTERRPGVLVDPVAGGACSSGVEDACSAHGETRFPGTCPIQLKVAHDISPLLIVLIFLAWHLLNHASAVLGLELNPAMMNALRKWYRSLTITVAQLREHGAG